MCSDQSTLNAGNGIIRLFNVISKLEATFFMIKTELKLTSTLFKLGKTDEGVNYNNENII